jgi:putative membrane protein
MAKKIVLVIDRDDDLGVKTGISSPVIGRDNVISSAVRLGTADPEDSDVNAMFAAVKVYDSLKENGEDVEIVVICGDKSVGVVSDSKIAEQMDRVVMNLKPSSAIVVTDGSEDEFVLPIVSSRVKIDSVQRVVVKQSRTIESTYFLLRRMLNDPKIARITLAPLGMIFLVYSIFLVLQHPEWGLGGIIFFLGIYFMIKAYGWEKNIGDFLDAVRVSLVEGRLSFIFYVTSGILLIISIVNGFNAAINITDVSQAVASFVFYSTWWFVLSGIFSLLARAADAYAERRRVSKYFTIIFLLIAFGLLVWASALYVLQPESPDALQRLGGSILGAILIAAFGVFTLRRL